MDKQGKKTGGRVKGRKNLKTREKEAVQTDARIVATAAVLSAVKSRPAKAAGPRPGMSAKDILVDAMREAHDAYRAQCLKASEVMDVANVHTFDALALTIAEGEKPDVFKARVAEALSIAAKVREESVAIRAEASASLALALDTAHKVAPYDHAKLQTSTVQGEMVLNVKLAKF